MCACTHVYICIIAHMWKLQHILQESFIVGSGDQNQALGLNGNYLYTLSNLVSPSFFFSFLKTRALIGLSSLIRLNWLAIEPQRSICLCPPSTGITNVHYYA